MAMLGRRPRLTGRLQIFYLYVHCSKAAAVVIQLAHHG